MLEFTFTTRSSHGRNPPKIKCGDDIIVIPEGSGKITFSVPDSELIEFDFFNKVESDTIIENGIIVADSEFKFETAWCNNIKLESWFVLECNYYPRYFSGFVDQFPNAPTEIKDPYQFNFPGRITWTWQGNFWDWYFIQRNQRTVINFLDKDPDRVWKFNGSLDPCDDLLKKIREII
jgi:hypothetical protein